MIGFHLWHGVSSALQSFGINSPTWTPRLQLIGRGLARGPRPRLRDAADLHLHCGDALMILDPRIPSGPITDKWDRRKFENKLVNPANRRKYQVIVVGTGLAGASAAASLGELGYPVKAFFIHDSPRRAHSIAAQGGINAAKNYRNDGDSVYRLFYDTIKGGDYRAREANVYRLAQTSVNIIDQCVAQGVPFAREYGGLLDNRSFGGAQVSRTFYARGQTGQQLLLGAYQSLMRQVDAGTVTLFPRREMLDLVTVDGKARGIVVPQPGHRRARVARRRDAVLLCTGGYGTVFYLSTNAINSNVTAAWRAHKRGALLRQSLLHADSSDLHSGQRRSPVEADADVGKPAQRRPRLGAEDSRATSVRRRRFPRPSATITSSAAIRASATWSRATSPRGPRRPCATKAAAPAIRACRCTWISPTRSSASGVDTITGALRQPVRHVSPHHRRESVSGADAHLPRRALHDGRAVGGLQPAVDDPRPVRARRSEFLRPRRQPPRRQRADAGTGRRLFRRAVHGGQLSRRRDACRRSTPTHDAFGAAKAESQERIDRVLQGQGQAHRARVPPRHRRDLLGQRRHGAHRRRTHAGGHRDPQAARRVLAGRERPGRGQQPQSRASTMPAASPTTWSSPRCWPSTRSSGANPAAATSAKNIQTPDGEALRKDDEYAYVAAWEFKGVGTRPLLHKEPLVFEEVHPTQRSYK